MIAGISVVHACIIRVEECNHRHALSIQRILLISTIGKVAHEAKVNRSIASSSIGLSVHFHNYSELKCGNLR